LNNKSIQLGKIDFLLNIGGISQRARIDETPIWLDRKIFEINYFGTIALTKAVLPFMVKQRSGHILATSSISGRFGFPLRSAYSASKQALHGFFETLYLKIKNLTLKPLLLSLEESGRLSPFMHLILKARNMENLTMVRLREFWPQRAAEIIIREC